MVDFYYTDEEFIEEALKDLGKGRDEFTEPLFDDKDFMLGALKYFYDIPFEVIDRMGDKLWNDMDVCLEVYGYFYDELDYFMDKIPVEHLDSLWFIVQLVRRKSDILWYIPGRYLNNEKIFYIAIDEIDSPRLDWRVNEFMFIVNQIPNALWDDSGFVEQIIYYANDYLDKNYHSDEVESFFGMIPERYWNDEDFVYSILSDRATIYSFEIIFDYISDELKSNEEFVLKVKEELDIEL